MIYQSCKLTHAFKIDQKNSWNSCFVSSTIFFSNFILYFPLKSGQFILLRFRQHLLTKCWQKFSDHKEGVCSFLTPCRMSSYDVWLRRYQIFNIWQNWSFLPVLAYFWSKNNFWTKNKPKQVKMTNFVICWIFDIFVMRYRMRTSDTALESWKHLLSNLKNFVNI